VAVSEVFLTGQGLVINVQYTATFGIFALIVVEMFLHQNNLSPERSGEIILSVDGVGYRVKFTLTDETMDKRTLMGQTKTKIRKAVQ
jgi:hypothetical protein